MIKTLMFTFKKWRGRYRRLKRLIYISPAEIRFIELMGGKVYVLRFLRPNENMFYPAIVLSMGSLLKREGFKREVRYGKYFVDFANDLNRIIEIDGSQWHMDVVADMDREIYIKELCWRFEREREAKIMRIPAFKLNLEPERVQAKTLKFIADGKT